MRTYIRPLLGTTLAAVMAVGATGCDEFLTVENPEVVEAATIDPLADATTFARSAQQDLIAANGWSNLYGAWFTGEMWVGDTFPTRNEFGYRRVEATNGTLNTELYSPIQQAIASGTRTLGFLAGSQGEENNANVVRAAFVKGYGALLMAELFCQGVISNGEANLGSPLTTAETADSAIAQFSRVITQGRALRATGTGVTPVVTAGDVTEAGNLVNASLMLRARAKLLRGDNAGAMADADAVPANFSYSFNQVDDPNARTRLGNRLYQYIFSREALVVPDAYRAIAASGDSTRIRFNDAGRVAQDGVLRFYRQQKYTAWADPIRVASKLEARYLSAEASGNNAARLALINERRRVVAGATEFTSTDSTAVLRELFDQKSRDFWLEGKRMGDIRRRGALVPYQLVPGSNYYKPGFQVGDQVCLPLPVRETNNNPNFPDS